MTTTCCVCAQTPFHNILIYHINNILECFMNILISFVPCVLMADAERVEDEEEVVPTYGSEHVKCAQFVKAVLLSVCDHFEVLDDDDPDYEKGNLLSKAFIAHTRVWKKQ